MSILATFGKTWKKMSRQSHLKHEPIFGATFTAEDQWGVECIFEPTHNLIDLSILAGDAGPNESHLRAYQQLEEHYLPLQNDIANALLLTLQQERQRSYSTPHSDLKREELWGECRLSGALIPSADILPLRLYLYYSFYSLGMEYEVEFEDWRIVEVKNIGE